MNFLVPPLPLRNRVDYDGRAELTFSACRPDAAHLNFFAHLCMYVSLHDCVKTHARIITYITSPTTYAHAISPLQKFSIHTHTYMSIFTGLRTNNRYADLLEHRCIFVQHNFSILASNICTVPCTFGCS